ncbi:MAG: amidohydrolase [Verrucomicrobiaceae bacterium]|nr:amidohydrolase [Verrucomicrobiaceae bacterium]
MTSGKIVLAFLAAVVGASGADLKNDVEKVLPSLVALYKELHANPELSLQEKETATRVAEQLKAAGFEVTSGFGGHGVVGVLKNGAGPTLLVRTDLDALPVKEQTGLPYASKCIVKDLSGLEVPVMHACGHDVHMASFIGTAKVMSSLKSEWAGTLVMIGQPAEEKVMGARLMLRAGLFEKFPKPDRAIALHCSADMAHGTVGIVEGFALANVDSVDITVRGLGGHGSMPHLAKDPVVLAASIVMALQTIVSRETRPGDPAVVTVGSIHGGTKHNIIPDEVKLQLTLRSYEKATRIRLIESIKRIVRHQAEAYGMPDSKMPDVKVSEETANALYNPPEFAKVVASAIEQSLGKGNVIPREPSMGAEDFSEFGITKEKVPICMFWLGTQPPEEVEKAKLEGRTLPSLHSPFFKPVPEPTIRAGVIATASAALHVLAKSQN